MAKAAKIAGGKAGARRTGVGKTSGGRSLVWLSGLACGALVAVAPGLAVLAAGLLAPGLAALKLERELGRPVARAMLTCGLAGCVRPVILLWDTGYALDTALVILTTPWAVGPAWSAAAAGWLMTELAPLGVRAALEAGALARAARLRVLRARIAEAWGVVGEVA